MIVSSAAERKPFLEAIPVWVDAESGAEVVQLTSQPVISTNVHMEQRFASADGRRIAIERQPFGQNCGVVGVRSRHDPALPDRRGPGDDGQLLTQRDFLSHAVARSAADASGSRRSLHAQDHGDPGR